MNKKPVQRRFRTNSIRRITRIRRLMQRFTAGAFFTALANFTANLCDRHSFATTTVETLGRPSKAWTQISDYLDFDLASLNRTLTQDHDHRP